MVATKDSVGAEITKRLSASLSRVKGVHTVEIGEYGKGAEKVDSISVLANVAPTISSDESIILKVRIPREGDYATTIQVVLFEESTLEVIQNLLKSIKKYFSSRGDINSFILLGEGPSKVIKS